MCLGELLKARNLSHQPQMILRQTIITAQIGLHNFKYFQSLQFNNAYNHFAMFDIVLIAGEVAEYSSPL